MADLPRPAPGLIYPACRWCPARMIESNVCNPLLLDGVRYRQPYDCPLPNGSTKETYPSIIRLPGHER